MKYPIKLIAPLLGLGILLGLNAEESRAQTQGCKELGPLPTTINTSGIYCLKSNRTVAAAPIGRTAILINASNVMLDLGGFRLRGPGGGSVLHKGIACLNCSQVVVRNGIVQGFAYGILLGESNIGHSNVVEKIQAYRNAIISIGLTGHAGIVRDNTIIDPIRNNLSGESIAIQMQGTGMRAINNDIVAANAVNNPNLFVRGIFFVTGGGFPDSPDNLAINNRITGTDEGITYFESNGKFRDNLTSGVTTPFTGGVDAGNND
jgi:hypothetical protein